VNKYHTPFTLSRFFYF